MYKLVVYQDRKKQYRWRLVSKQKIVADSGEGYVTKSNAVRATKRLKIIAWNAVLE